MPTCPFPPVPAPGRWATARAFATCADGVIAPPTAQFAIREARCLAREPARDDPRTAHKPFRYRQRGSMAAIGHRRGVAEVFGVSLWGFAAWLLWRAYYLSQMPTFGRKLRIFVEWSWAALFRTDITHLRFHRTVDLQAPGAGLAKAKALRST